MVAAKTLNSKAKVPEPRQHMQLTSAQPRRMQDALRTNLEPNGARKMPISRDIKLTKHDNLLLPKTQIGHPTASLIAHVTTALDDMSGDCTNFNLITGKRIEQVDVYISEGLHLRTTTCRFESAKVQVPQLLEEVKMDKDSTSRRPEVLTEVVAASILAVTKQDEPTDLFMAEIIDMKHKSETNTSLLRDLVLDQRAWCPDGKKRVEDSYVLIRKKKKKKKQQHQILAFFKTRIQKRENLVKAERKFIDTIKNMTELKKENLLFNEKGTDPFPKKKKKKKDITALCRAKKRSIERLTLPRGGIVKSFDDLNPDCLGRAGFISEYILGKLTFSKKCNNPRSVT
uniref:Uncharacterized protein n=1 Tax=Mustela putorius furo TaxID=9669 RepID=M3YHV8_MUSPF